MLMMRSTPVTKLGKPPPPVPPRPSKTLVAEALAKTRKPPPISDNKPTRIAPLPPKEVTKSKSSVCVNVVLNKKPIPYERSISEEIKNNSRPIVYQSTNVKTSSKVNLTLTRNDSIDSTKNNNNNNVLNGEGVNNERCATKPVERVSSLRNNSESNIITEEQNSEDKKWDKILNDRNHVNTLIDEMFASVLEIDTNEENDNVNTDTTTFPTNIDKTEIIITDDNKVNSLEQTIDNNSADVESVPVESPKTVIIITTDNCAKNDQNNLTDEERVVVDTKSNSSTMEKQKKSVKFSDQLNHELLISELQSMKKDHERISKRQRLPSSIKVYDNNNSSDDDKIKNNTSEVPKIQTSDWVEVSDGHEVRLSSCQITIEDLKDDNNGKNETDEISLDYERITKMSSLHGLPPLPKSLSGFNLLENHGNPPTPMRTSSIRSGQSPSPASGHLVYPPHPKTVNGSPSSTADAPLGRKSSNLDAQLAILRREMYSLRQLDLSLLSQLWSLNESIQDFRQILQEQEDRVLSPPTPSPTPSSGEDPDGDEFYMSTSSLNFRPAPPPPPTGRRTSSSSNTSSIC